MMVHADKNTAHVGRLFIEYIRRIRVVVRIDSPLAALDLFPLVQFYNFASVYTITSIQLNLLESVNFDEADT